MAKMKFQFEFVNNDGIIELEGKFPKKMSLKQAIRFSVRKHDFVLAELLARREVRNDGGDTTCALCRYAEEIYSRSEVLRDECQACVICHKTGEADCGGTPWKEIQWDLRKDGSFRVPNVRRQIKFLKALEADYE